MKAYTISGELNRLVRCCLEINLRTKSNWLYAIVQLIAASGAAGFQRVVIHDAWSLADKSSIKMQSVDAYNQNHLGRVDTIFAMLRFGKYIARLRVNLANRKTIA